MFWIWNDVDDSPLQNHRPDDNSQEACDHDAKLKGNIYILSELLFVPVVILMLLYMDSIFSVMHGKWLICPGVSSVYSIVFIWNLSECAEPVLPHQPLVILLFPSRSLPERHQSTPPPSDHPVTTWSTKRRCVDKLFRNSKNKKSGFYVYSILINGTAENSGSRLCYIPSCSKRYTPPLWRWQRPTDASQLLQIDKNR